MLKWHVMKNEDCRYSITYVSCFIWPFCNFMLFNCTFMCATFFHSSVTSIDCFISFSDMYLLFLFANNSYIRQQILLLEDLWWFIHACSRIYIFVLCVCTFGDMVAAIWTSLSLKELSMGQLKQQNVFKNPMEFAYRPAAVLLWTKLMAVRAIVSRSLQKRLQSYANGWVAI